LVASAEVLLFGAKTNLRQISGTARWVSSPQRQRGRRTTLTFSTTQANQRVVIFFDASCRDLNEANPTSACVAILVDPAGAAVGIGMNLILRIDCQVIMGITRRIFVLICVA
jgi:hypothetical protein